MSDGKYGNVRGYPSRLRYLTGELPSLVQVLELPGRLDVVGEQEELQVGRRRPHQPLRQERDRHRGTVLRESEVKFVVN